MVLLPVTSMAQHKISCVDPVCTGWYWHNNNLIIGNNVSESFIPKATLHLHTTSSVNNYMCITNNTTGFPGVNDTLGLYVGLMGNNAILFQAQNAPLSLYTNKRERLTIVGDGKVGIGTLNPQNVLHIHKNISTGMGGTAEETTEEKSNIINPNNNPVDDITLYGIQITNTYTGTTATDGIKLAINKQKKSQLMSFENGNFGIGTNNMEILTLTPQGYVGIGITTPSAKFHTKGTLRFEGLGNATNNQNQKVLLVDASGNVSQATTNLVGDNMGNHIATQNIKMSNNWLSNDGNSKGIKISDNGDVLIYGTMNGTKTFEQNNGFEIVTCGRIPERRGISLDNDPSGNMNFWIHAWQSNAAFNFIRNDQGSVKKLMVINQNGQVGINMDNPQYNLHVKGNICFEQLPALPQITSEAVLVSDNQGVIKSTPAIQLKDNLGNHTATQNIRMSNNWLSNDGNSKGIKISDNGDVLIYGTMNGTKTFEQNNGFEIVTCGRIPERRGISLDNDPSGNMNFWIHAWQSNAAFNFIRNDQGSVKKLMVINQNGQVGINMDNPQYNLHVKGNICFEQLPVLPQITSEAVLVSDNQGAIKSTPATQLKDNLGNHTATQNIKMSNNWLSNDGSNNGIQIKDNGNIQIGNGITQVNIGQSYTMSPNYLSSYVGFNVQRNAQGQWTFASDGANNGGASVTCDVSGGLRFITVAASGGSSQNFGDAAFISKTKLFISNSGKVGIGTDNPQHELDVRGTAHFCKAIVKSPGWCDFVFDHTYTLMPLNELKSFIEKNKHLPGIPTEKEIQENDMDLAKMNKLLLQKIEELTLYIIRQQEEINQLKNK